MEDPTFRAGWTPDAVQAALRQIVTRAGVDPEFRQLCLANPPAAVREVTGRALPKRFDLRFVDNARASLTVVLPDLAPTAELSDADLEAVSGGIKCLVGTCGATEVCGITDPCLSSKGEDNPAGKKSQR